MDQGMKKLLPALWLPVLIGTAVHGLRVEKNLKKEVEPEPFRNFHHSCMLKSFSQPASSSVHTLTPSDIQAVAAIGSLGNIGDSRMQHSDLQDSIPRNLIQTSMGTLTALVSRFNPSVRHYSSPGNSRAASQMGTSSLLEQAEELIHSMRDSQELDYEKNWKLITIFYPYSSRASDSPESSPLDSIKGLEEVLDFLHEKVPKAFVNLVDSTQLPALSNPHMDQNMRSISDSCIGSIGCSTLDDIIRRWSYQNTLEKLLASKWYDQSDDFAVVPQTSLQEAEVHPARNGRDNVDSPKRSSVEIPGKEFSALGVELWNNMMEPIGQKQPYRLSKITKPVCPSQEHPYFFTYRNSNYSPSPVESAQEQQPEQLSFGTIIPCSDRSPSDTVPQSVHKLRPADIKVIGALGDSLTAANGAGSSPLNIADVLVQYRGLSWSVGGDENVKTVTTLANILREFNPSLTGFSTGRGTHQKPNASLNQAVAGAVSEGLSSQARRLVDLMKGDTKINFQEDWKLVTVFIGGNDLCASCTSLEQFSPENFVSNIQTALDILHKEVPRLFVNLVTVLHITTLSELYHEESVKCPKKLMSSLCSCAVNHNVNAPEMEVLEILNKKYQDATRHLIETGRYDTREDFTVVVQPFLEGTTMPKTAEGVPDASFFAPDCFHFQQKTHSQAARALWNNMLEPLGEKTDAQRLEDEIILKCPSPDQPYLRTQKNSGYSYPTQPLEVYGSQMLCKNRAPSVISPVSVHSLKPADMQVIAALGDSLTAGNAIGSKPNDMSDLNTQYRGLAWSIGGDASLRTVTTLSNILLEFNTNLTGYSTSTGGPSDPISFLNRAVPGAQAEDLSDQAEQLVKLMKNDSRINFDTDWKIITIFIGIHDLCNYCKDINHYSAANFSSRIQKALDILHAEVPRTLVNLVEVMDFLPLRQLFLDSRLPCSMRVAEESCGCILPIKEGSSELMMMSETVKAYQNSMQNLVETGRYDTREDFTVVLQPFLRNISLPLLQGDRPDISFFAPDCFHLSQKSHSQLSRALWNNMLEPLGKKTFSCDFTANITLGCPTTSQPFLGTYKNSNYTYSPLEPTKKPNQNWGSDLSCPGQTPSEEVPTSVHKLRPSDIQVIAALGDSLTTAVGAQATGLSDLKTSWRGLSWSAGSEGSLESHTTLPNILKKFNPNLSGFSTGTEKETAGFNRAVGEATAQNLSAQALELVELMKSSPDINYKEDWKLVTILIGRNDLCQYCLDRDTYSVGKYVQHLQDSLDILYAELPRAFVNVVEIMELTGLRQIEREASGCVLSGLSLCPCFLKPQENSAELQEMQRVNRDFQERSTMMINGGRYDKREDFAVVVQPFFQNTNMPLDRDGKPDLSFFAVDCFHFSARGYASMAAALWNNMLEPVGQKQSYNNFTYERSTLTCPTSEHPFLFTSRNSGSQTSGSTAENNRAAVPYWAVIVAVAAGILAGSPV
ncbi:phospholipase B1, membrane-associated [Paroedura picta]|uniref:phospholipase B1, membrane-associated n=1 Tax=Paroedura picta TaxID=143630 RepID=UPI004056C141